MMYNSRTDTDRSTTVTTYSATLVDPSDAVVGTLELADNPRFIVMPHYENERSESMALLDAVPETPDGEYDVEKLLEGYVAAMKILDSEDAEPPKSMQIFKRVGSAVHVDEFAFTMFV